MTVQIPEDADLDARLLDLGLLQEHGTEILGVAAGFPLMGLGLTQIFRMVDESALTSGQKAWAKVAATAAVGAGGGAGIIALGKSVRERSISEITTFAGVGAFAVSLGSIVLQGFQGARGVGIIPRKTPEGQIVPPRPDQIIPPVTAFEFR